ncbi:MAG: SGNH/GDSL hydrolase family protein [Burkholderiales bacterium]|nr:SGNH/GDSL hydrolase family protein [Burkholderiales bacterium]
MQHLGRAVLALSLAALLGACSSIVPQAHVPRIVVFGDSNVDNGNLYKLTGDQLPPPPNWRGRNSNGPNVVEYLAKDVGATLEDYAVSGATTGQLNIVGHFSPALARFAGTGMSWQIGEFIKTGHPFSDRDVIILWAGSNDIFHQQRNDAGLLQLRIAEASANIRGALHRLYGLGARRIVVATRTPREMIGNDNDMNGVDLNRQLRQLVADTHDLPGAHIMVFDAYASVADMMQHPARYGFSENGQLCVVVPACASERYEDGLHVADTYINWDAAHKTTHVHRIMAQQLAQLLRHQAD